MNKLHFRTSLFILPFIFVSCGPIWRSPAYYEDYAEIRLNKAIMTSDEYGKVIETHARPYVVEFHGSTGAILLFGAEHTKDPANPQIQQIRESWKTFKPTVALVEGRMGFLFRWFMDPIREFGESGLVLDLAKDSGIDFYTWEPSFEKEIEFQLQRFPAKRVALFYVIRPYASNYRHGKPDDLDEFLEEYRSKRTKYPGLEGTLPSIGTIDSMWRTDFPESKDWRDLSDMYGYPGYLQEIFVESNSFRDEHFARSILDLVNKGQRVFAVCGSSHAVKLDSTLRVEVAKGK